MPQARFITLAMAAPLVDFESFRLPSPPEAGGEGRKRGPKMGAFGSRSERVEVIAGN